MKDALNKPAVPNAGIASRLTIGHHRPGVGAGTLARMRAPRTLTIFITAIGLVLLAAVWIPNYYPAPVPVLAADGSPVIGPDGTPVVHRDMASYYRLVWPGLVSVAASFLLLGWWLVRVLRSLYERVFISRKTS